jgi:integrase
MGKRRRLARQQTMWVARADLPQSAGHPFYERLNRVLDDAGCDAFVEAACAPFYVDGVGRQSLPPMRIHDLRHTCASLLLAQGVHPRVVMETLSDAGRYTRGNRCIDRLNRHAKWGAISSKEILDIPETQAETVVEPDGVIDDFTGIGIRSSWAAG